MVGANTVNFVLLSKNFWSDPWEGKSPELQWSAVLCETGELGLPIVLLFSPVADLYWLLFIIQDIVPFTGLSAG